MTTVQRQKVKGKSHKSL